MLGAAITLNVEDKDSLEEIFGAPMDAEDTFTVTLVRTNRQTDLTEVTKAPEGQKTLEEPRPEDMTMSDGKTLITLCKTCNHPPENHNTLGVCVHEGCGCQNLAVPVNDLPLMESDDEVIKALEAGIGTARTAVDGNAKPKGRRKKAKGDE